MSPSLVSPEQVVRAVWFLSLWCRGCEKLNCMTPCQCSQTNKFEQWFWLEMTVVCPSLSASQLPNFSELMLSEVNVSEGSHRATLNMKGGRQECFFSVIFRDTSQKKKERLSSACLHESAQRRSHILTLLKMGELFCAPTIHPKVYYSTNEVRKDKSSKLVQTNSL